MYSVLPHPTIIMLPRIAFLTHHYVHVAFYTDYHTLSYNLLHVLHCHPTLSYVIHPTSLSYTGLFSHYDTLSYLQRPTTLHIHYVPCPTPNLSHPTLDCSSILPHPSSTSKRTNGMDAIKHCIYVVK